jgi:hypothetical protein
LNALRTVSTLVAVCVALLVLFGLVRPLQAFVRVVLGEQG